MFDSILRSYEEGKLDEKTAAESIKSYLLGAADVELDALASAGKIQRETARKIKLDRMAQSPSYSPARMEDSPEAESRGVFEDVAKSAIAGLVADLPEIVARGARTLDPEGGVDIVRDAATSVIDWAEGLEQYGMFRPSKESQESEFRRSLTGGVRAMPTSIGAGLPGAALGALGGVGGAVAGFAASGGTVFGLAAYDEFIEDARDAGVDPKIAHSQAVKAAFLEGGMEAASNLLELMTMKAGRLVTQPLKQTAREIMSTSGKQVVGNLAKTAAIEVPTEMVQEGGGAKLRQDVGIEAMAPLEAAKEAIGPALVMSLLFGGGVSGLNIHHQRKIKNALTDPSVDENLREKAVIAVASALESKGKKQYAFLWEHDAMKAVKAGEAVEIDTQLDEIDMTATAVELVRDKVTQLKEAGMEKEAKSLQKAFNIALEKKKKGDEITADELNMVIPEAELGEDGVQYGKKGEESFASLSAESDKFQEEIDVVHDKLTEEGIPFDEQESKSPELAELYKKRIEVDTRAAQRAYSGGKAIFEEELKGVGASNLYSDTDSILRDIYSLTDKPLGGAYFLSTHTSRAMSEGGTVKKLAKKLAPMILAQDKPSADFWATMGSDMSGITKQGKEEVLSKALQKAEAIHERMKGFFLEETKQLPSAQQAPKTTTPSTNQALSKQIAKGTTAKEALITIGRGTSPHAQLAREVASLIDVEGAKVKLTQGNRERAAYFPDSDRIEIPKLTKTTEEDVMHEVLHGAASYKLSRYVSSKKVTADHSYLEVLKEAKKNKSMPKEVRQLIDLFSYVAEEKGLRVPIEMIGADPDAMQESGYEYGMGDIHEFLSEAFSSKEFQDVLRGIKLGKNNTAWDKFVNIVRQMLGLSEKTTTALDEALRIGKDVVKSKRPAYGRKVSKAQKQVEGFHGSGAAFEKFMLEFMGTGEGAQAFGWGAYITSAKGIALDYARKLGKKAKTEYSGIKMGGKDFWEVLGDDSTAQLAYQYTVSALEESNGDIGGAIDVQEDYIAFTENATKNLPVAEQQAIRAELAHIDMSLDILTGKHGDVQVDIKKLDSTRNLYRVTLHKGKDPSQYAWLDWNKRENKLPQEVLDAIPTIEEKRGSTVGYVVKGDIGSFSNTREDAVRRATGAKIYKALTKKLGSDEKASLFLLRAGIDGNRVPSNFLSRTPSKTDFTYVMFNADDITIEEHTQFAPKKKTKKKEEPTLKTYPIPDTTVTDLAITGRDEGFEEFVYQLVTGHDRLRRIKVAKVAARYKQMKKEVGEEGLKDIGAYIEGIGNIETKATAEEVKKKVESSPELTKVADEIMITTEAMRKEVNKMLEFMGKEDRIKFVENYILHRYAGKKGIKKVVKKRVEDLGMGEKWAKSSPQQKLRTLKTLEEAMNKDYTPVTQDAGYLQVMWANMNYRMAVNNMLIHELKNKKLVNTDGNPVIMKESENPPDDYITFKHKALDTVVWDKGKQFTYPVKIDPTIAPYLKALLQEPISAGWMRKITKVNAFLKKGALSFSLFHHFALSESSIAALTRFNAPGKGTVAGLVRGIFVVGKEAREYLDQYKADDMNRLQNWFFPVRKYLPIVPTYYAGVLMRQDPNILRDTTMAGMMTDSSEDVQASLIERTLMDIEAQTRNVKVIGTGVKGLRKANSWWDRKLWDGYHTGLKMYAYQFLVDEAINDAEFNPKADLTTSKDVLKMKQSIAAGVNDMFGGQDWVAKTWATPQMRQVLQMALLAPDWTYTSLNIARKGLTGLGSIFVPDFVAKSIMKNLGDKPIVGKALKVGLHDINKVKTPHQRKILFDYWRNMFVFSAFFTIGMSMALAGKPPWENEEDKWDEIDITDFWNKYSPWADKNDKSRHYMHPGKQYREVLGWVKNPLKTIGSKAAPSVQEAIRQWTGTEPGGIGFDAPWQRENMSFYESMPSRLLSIAEKFVPFSFRGGSFAFTLPMSKGMTRWKAMRAYEDLLQAEIGAGIADKGKKYLDKMTKKNRGELRKKLDDAVVANGNDPVQIYKQTLYKLRSRYYAKMWDHLQYKPWNPAAKYHQAQAERYAKLLVKLGAKTKSVVKSGRNKDYAVEDIKAALQAISKARKSVKKKVRQR